MTRRVTSRGVHSLRAQDPGNALQVENGFADFPVERLENGAHGFELVLSQLTKEHASG